jgi:hypothetical protein
VTAIWILLAFAAGAAVTWLVLRQWAGRQVAEAAAQSSARIAGLEARLQAADDRQTILTKAEQTLRDAFRSMASEALQANSQSLTALAQASLEQTSERVKGDLDRRQAAIAELVRPISETLVAVDQKLSAVERDRVATTASLVEQLKFVGTGTAASGPTWSSACPAASASSSTRKRRSRPISMRSRRRTTPSAC